MATARNEGAEQNDQSLDDLINSIRIRSLEANLARLFGMVEQLTDVVRRLSDMHELEVAKARRRAMRPTRPEEG